jgi:hypothetical protein
MRHVGKYGFFSLLFLLAGSSNAWADSAESRATWFFLLSVTDAKPQNHCSFASIPPHATSRQR